MNGFKKNKNGTTKRSARYESENDLLWLNLAKESKPDSLQNGDGTKKKDK